MATSNHRRKDKQTPVDLANSMTDMVTCSTEWGEKDDDKEECTEEGDNIVKRLRQQGRSGKNDSSSSSSSLFSSSSKEMTTAERRRDDKQTPVDLAKSITDMVTCNTEWGEKDDDKEECTEEGDNIENESDINDDSFNEDFIPSSSDSDSGSDVFPLVMSKAGKKHHHKKKRKKGPNSFNKQSQYKHQCPFRDKRQCWRTHRQPI
uniref:Uncharacterized protein n=1 Tax=Magallana gigas TaxID=29159 RepID=A0A8W8JIH9_MAGGI|nr:uncharacterized protein LOC105321412 isoform X3 [Crassostrea gigas]